jgi:hypothetical protein
MTEYGKLAGFVRRLGDGVYASANSARPPSPGFRDDEAFRSWPGSLFESLADIRRGNGDVGQPAVIEELAERLRTTRPLLIGVLFSPDVALDRLLACADLGEPFDKRIVNSWIAMGWTAEAAWRAVRAGLPAEHGYAEGDAEFLRPLAARLRFLALSEPMRWRGEPDRAWWGWKADRSLSGGGVLARVFGPNSWLTLVGWSQEARREWLDVLNEYQSHPVLSQVRPSALEAELRCVVFRGDRTLSRPLCLSGGSLTTDGPLTAQDRAVSADVIDLHLLPRFALLAVARLVLDADGRALFAGVVAAAGIAAVVSVALLHVRLAALLAAVCYGLICLSALLPGRGLGPMWLLRMPAASAVGFVAIMAMMVGGWLVPSVSDWWYAPLGLGLASFGYLVVEARAHGVGPVAALARSSAVWFVGAVHAVLVGVIGLVVVAPAFTAGSGKLAHLWSDPVYARGGLVLALTAAWCLTVGVFSQILWDDRPITAPLAHMSWRKS